MKILRFAYILWAGAVGVYGQTPYSGEVRFDGRPAPFARLAFQPIAAGQPVVLWADTAGGFYTEALGTGRYNLTVSYLGEEIVTPIVCRDEDLGCDTTFAFQSEWCRGLARARHEVLARHNVATQGNQPGEAEFQAEYRRVFATIEGRWINRWGKDPLSPEEMLPSRGAIYYAPGQVANLPVANAQDHWNWLLGYANALGVPPPYWTVRPVDMLEDHTFMPAPAEADTPFIAHARTEPCPWNPNEQLVLLEMASPMPNLAVYAPLQLTIVIDASASMAAENRLMLLRNGLEELLARMRPGDHLSVVYFNSGANVLFENYGYEDRGAALVSLNSLRSAGGTAAQDGLALGAEIAEKHHQPNARNVLLFVTDGMFFRFREDGVMRQLRRKNILVNTLGVKMTSTEYRALQDLAEEGGGVAYHLEDSEGYMQMIQRQFIPEGTVNVSGLRLRAEMPNRWTCLGVTHLPPRVAQGLSPSSLVGRLDWGQRRRMALLVQAPSVAQRSYDASQPAVQEESTASMQLLYALGDRQLAMPIIHLPRRAAETDWPLYALQLHLGLLLANPETTAETWAEWLHLHQIRLMELASKDPHAIPLIQLAGMVWAWHRAGGPVAGR